MRMAAIFQADGECGSPFVLDLDVGDSPQVNSRLLVEQAVEKYLFDMHNRLVRKAVEEEGMSEAALDFHGDTEADTFELSFTWEGHLLVEIRAPLLADILLIGFAPEDWVGLEL